MQYCLLGPLRVADDARTYTPTAPKIRQVLALLLLNGNQLVPVSTFIEELWGEEPPASALTTLQTYIYQLRKLFGDGRTAHSDGGFLITRPAGYIARVLPGELDVPLFDDRVEQSRTSAEKGDPDHVARMLREAFMLWRGPALVDVPKGPVLQARATFLEESRVSALERRIDADLQLGRHGDLIGELRVLISANPLREAFYAQLMLALSRCGRRSEALHVYQSLRRVLIEELGIEPSQRVQHLQRALLTADSSLDPVFREQLRLFSPGVVAPAQVPADTADFTDRRRELEQVRDLLTSSAAGHGSVAVGVITGPPGIGKTALSIRAAHQLRPRFPDGQLYADLGASADPCQVVGSFLRGLGVPGDQMPHDLAERSKQFRTWTADRRILVLLDNAESAAQVRPLLPGGPRCAVLVTSWRQLRGLAGAEAIQLGPLDLDKGVEFLAGLIGRPRVYADTEGARKVVTLCDRHPLAIRAAGAKLAIRPDCSLRVLAERLHDPGSRLAELSTSDLDPQIPLQRAYGRLCDREQRALRLLSLLEPGRASARQMATLLGMEPHQVDAVMGGLAEAHLVAVEELDGGQVCYTCRGLVRTFARELVDRDERAIVRSTVEQDPRNGAGDIVGRQLVS